MEALGRRCRSISDFGAPLRGGGGRLAVTASEVNGVTIAADWIRRSRSWRVLLSGPAGGGVGAAGATDGSNGRGRGRPRPCARPSRCCHFAMSAADASLRFSAPRPARRYRDDPESYPFGLGRPSRSACQVRSTLTLDPHRAGREMRGDDGRHRPLPCERRDVMRIRPRGHRRRHQSGGAGAIIPGMSRRGISSRRRPRSDCAFAAVWSTTLVAGPPPSGTAASPPTRKPTCLFLRSDGIDAGPGVRTARAIEMLNASVALDPKVCAGVGRPRPALLRGESVSHRRDTGALRGRDERASRSIPITSRRPRA